MVRDEIERRYQLLSLWEVRNIESYNQKITRLNVEGIAKEAFTPLNLFLLSWLMSFPI